jgi:hypothetical protein
MFTMNTSRPAPAAASAGPLLNRRELLQTLGAAGLSLTAASLAAAHTSADPLPIFAKETTRRGQADVASPAEAEQIAREAYIYFYPLVTMEVTRRQATNIEPGKKPGAGPMNAFSHVPAFPDASFKAVVRPNFDTLYSLAYLDLRQEPMVVSTPDTAGRYYMLPMYDMWTDIFAVPGKRTTGTKAGSFAVVPPGWSGQLPAGVERINAPTPLVWIIGRTQTNGPKDYEAVHQVQAGYRIKPLSKWPDGDFTPAVKIDPTVDMKTPPLETVNKMPAAEFFRYAAELTKVNPPHLTDQPILARMKRIGLIVGQSFDLSQADPVARAAFEKAPMAGLQQMKESLPRMARVVNGWQMNTDTMGNYGTFYLKRAIVALVGLGANLPEDAVCPLNIADSEGKPLDGANKYLLHFEKADLPPAEAFWSVTMYDATGFQVANPINRFAIGDRDELKYNADGSLDIWIQHETPGKEQESNWLPAPIGPLGITMRVYAPRAEALDGRWAPPPIKKVV